MGANGRPWYFWPIIAFVVGLLIGLVVLGWGVWPVTWTNATIQDLRPELRMEYVTMVAQSYAQTRNLDVARQRLAGWSEVDLTKLLQETQTVLVARDPAEAANVQQLAVALNVAETPPGTAAGQGQTPGTAGGTAAEAPAAQPSRLRQICTAGIFIILALGALVALVYLFRRWRAAREAEDLAPAAPDFGPLTPPSTAEVAAQQEKARPIGYQSREWEESLPPATTVAPSGTRAEQMPDDDGVEPPAPTTAAAATPKPVGPVSSAPPRSDPAEMRVPPAGPAIPPATSAAGLQMLLEKTAIYQMGELGYDEKFDIDDPVAGYVGECGLQLPEPFGRERDRPVALQAWLFDSRDTYTHTLVLMSEGTYRDTALRSQYSGDHEAVSVRPGTEFELPTHNLLLKGRVEKVSYAEAEPVRGVFAELQVKMTVYRRS